MIVWKYLKLQSETIVLFYREMCLVVPNWVHIGVHILVLNQKNWHLSHLRFFNHVSRIQNFTWKLTLLSPTLRTTYGSLFPPIRCLSFFTRSCPSFTPTQNTPWKMVSRISLAQRIEKEEMKPEAWPWGSLKPVLSQPPEKTQHCMKSLSSTRMFPAKQVKYAMVPSSAKTSGICLARQSLASGWHQGRSWRLCWSREGHRRRPSRPGWSREWGERGSRARSHQRWGWQASKASTRSGPCRGRSPGWSRSRGLAKQTWSSRRRHTSPPHPPPTRPSRCSSRRLGCLALSRERNLEPAAWSWRQRESPSWVPWCSASSESRSPLAQQEALQPGCWSPQTWARPSWGSRWSTRPDRHLEKWPNWEECPVPGSEAGPTPSPPPWDWPGSLALLAAWCHRWQGGGWQREESRHNWDQASRQNTTDSIRRASSGWKYSSCKDK